MSSEVEKVEMEIEDGVGVAIFGIVTLMCSYLTLSVSRQMLSGSPMAAGKVSIAAMISFTLCPLAAFIAFLKVCVTNFNDGDGFASIATWFAYLFYFPGHFSVLWMLIFRIENTFREMQLVTVGSLRNLKIITVIVMALPLLVIVGIIIELETMVFAVAAVWLVIHISLFTTLFCMFLSRIDRLNRLENVSVAAAATVTVPDSTMQSGNETNLATQNLTADENKKVFLELTVRCTLLSGIAVLSTDATYLFGIILGVVIEIENAVSVWPFMLISMDCLVNCVCVYLFFQFNRDKYHRFCKCGHSVLERWKLKRLQAEVELADVTAHATR